jgi:predicted  nucleic acid-binding Zn-ribbon protein
MSNTAKQVIDFRPGKGIDSGVSNEELRRWSERQWGHALKVGNYDRSREHLNFEVTRGGILKPVDKTLSLAQRMADTLRQRGIKDPNEGLEEPRYRTTVQFIFGGSRDRMRQLAFGDQPVDFAHGADNSHIGRRPDIEGWAKDVYSFMAKRYGEENIVGFIVHLDETNPHVHCTLLPIDGRNRFAYKRLFAGKDIYDYKRLNKELHDELSRVNNRWGLERGSDVSETGARHRSTEEYRRWLSVECTSLEEQVANHRKALSSLYVELSIAEKKQKSFRTMIQNLSREKAEIEDRMASLRQQLAAQSGNSEALTAQIRSLEEKLTLTTSKLADKEAKLAETVRQLDVLRNDMDEIQQEADDLSQKARESQRSWSQHMAADLHAVMLERLVNEYQPLKARMEAADRQLFDGTLVNELAAYGNHILTVGLQLMCGYIDDATTFAQAHGGGGGGSDLPWGRDPNEDDREWARRCLAMARKLMRPSSGKQRKM